MSVLRLRWTGSTGPILVACLGLLALGCGAGDSPGAGTTAAVPVAAADPVARGEYLVAIMGCDDCHTPFAMGPSGPQPDMSRRLSGHPEALQVTAPPATDAVWAWSGAVTNTAFAGPWGVSYATNLTPDEATGMGVWSEDMFVAAIRDGKKFGAGRPILPPMPWPAYGHATDEDLKAIFAYLQSLEPIANQVPEAAINPPPA